MIKSHKKLGVYLREVREDYTKSIRQVGRDVSICPGIISRVERGVTKISFENAVILSDYYGVTLAALSTTLKRKNSHGKAKNKT